MINNNDPNKIAIISHTQIYWRQVPVCHETEGTWSININEHKYMLYIIVHDGIVIYQYVLLLCVNTFCVCLSTAKT